MIIKKEEDLFFNSKRREKEMDYYQLLGSKLVEWAEKVSSNIAAGLYPKEPFDLGSVSFNYSAVIFRGPNDFWQEVKRVLCATYELVDNKPDTEKREMIALDRLLPILREISEKRPEAEKLLKLLQRERLPGIRTFNRAVEQL